MTSKSALQIWRERWEFLQRERAIAASADLKFQLEQQIEECQQAIKQLEQNPKSSEITLPLSLTNIEHPSGTVQLTSQFYIKREPWESRSYQEIEKAAGLVCIKAPRQMGKTSLLARIRDHAVAKGYRIATLDFQETEAAIFEDLNQFLKRFCAIISRKVGIETTRIKEFWADDLFGLAQGDFTLAQLLNKAPTDGGIYGEHLRRHLWNLQQHPELAEALQKLVSSDRPVILQAILSFKLNGMGLVNLQGNDITLRYPRLYRPYFSERLGKNR